MTIIDARSLREASIEALRTGLRVLKWSDHLFRRDNVAFRGGLAHSRVVTLSFRTGLHGDHHDALTRCNVKQPGLQLLHGSSGFVGHLADQSREIDEHFGAGNRSRCWTGVGRWV